jgi:lycopene cyclase domain-containing protein
MVSPYITWLLIFGFLPVSVMWLFFYKYLWKYRQVFVWSTIFTLIFGAAWDVFAIKYKIWGWPKECCVLPRISNDLPTEEFLFMVMTGFYTSTMTLVARDIFLNHQKLKRKKS